MLRLKVRFQEEATLDLEQIYRWVYRVSASPDVAHGFVERIRARCHRIGNVPYGGTAREDLEPGLRTVPFEHTAIIAYRVESDCVRVTNIFYGGRDYEALYRDAESQ